MFVPRILSRIYYHALAIWYYSCGQKRELRICFDDRSPHLRLVYAQMASFHSDHLLDSKTWIRILVLEKGSDEQPLKASLERVLLETQLVYDAISYYVGPPESPYQISLSNGGPHLPLPITASLNHALRRFRLPAEERRLWADAICIDQKNDREKADQVFIMDKIYTIARKVLIYLGKPDETTQQAIKLLRNIHKATKDTPPTDNRRPFHGLSIRKYRRPTRAGDGNL